MKPYKRLHQYPHSIFDVLENINKQSLIDRGYDAKIITKEDINISRKLVRVI